MVTVIEDFNAFFIRMPSVRRFTFSALSVLHTLSRTGPSRLTDLLALEQVKQPALTSLVAKLERDGLVSRRRDPSDGRASLLSLTAEGEEVVRSRHASRVANLTPLVDQLSECDRDALADTARVLARLTDLAAAARGEHAPPVTSRRKARP